MKFGLYLSYAQEFEFKKIILIFSTDELTEPFY